MTDVFYERHFDQPLTDGDITEMLEDGASCFELYRVAWQYSLLSADRRRMICHFEGPDAESVRMAVAFDGGIAASVWSGGVHDAPDLDEATLAGANVVVTRRFEEPVEFDAVQAMEEAGIDCLNLRNVRFVRSYFSWDGKRMACLYNAPDAESVRMAQEGAKMPVDEVWAFQRIFPRPA